MSYFLNFRTLGVGGPVVDPYLLAGDGAAIPPALVVVPCSQIASIVAGRRLLFATHGFNVSYRDGACSLGLLERYLDLAPPGLLIAMLWPGDSWLPIVDYPFEGDVAIDCGQRLARFCDDHCAGAASISFASHSLGARMVLEAISRMNRPAESVCLTAAAINRDCLIAQYIAAARNSGRVSVLASHDDDVLKLAFPIGDPFADLLHDDHSPFQSALGYDGPPARSPQPVRRPWQIPDGCGFGHHDYLPPSPAIPLPPPPLARWPHAADFIRRAFLEERQTWPPS